MDDERRQQLAREALDGYASGPGAPIAATAAALAKAESAQAVVLVEGISDQIAVETLATRLNRNLEAEGTVVVPIGGAQSITQHLDRFGPKGAGLPIAGMCDEGEEDYFRRALTASGLGSPLDRNEMERLGFFVCVKDLEDELIRAAGRSTIEALLDSQGDLGSFQTLQSQPDWRGAEFDAQTHRWLRAGARRHLRYARLLVLAIPLELMPRPLEATLGGASPEKRGKRS